MTKVIAEIGWNHMGDMVLAKEMIQSSKENGADFVKFQTWSVERLKRGPWDTDGRTEIYKKAELSKDKHLLLKEYSDSIGLPFFSSVFSIQDAKLLKEVGVKSVKIASFESRNKELISYCYYHFDEVYLSTGTSSVEEVRESTRTLDKEKFTILHCVSSYPLLPKNCNLPRINKLKEFFPRVGYSDHTFGVETAKISLEHNPCVIEKHFTIDQSLPGRDNKFAILPHQLKELSDYINMKEEMNISHGDDYLDCEQEARNIMTGRFNG
jgi:N,N'-diacetyllegionaminate synthase